MYNPYEEMMRRRQQQQQPEMAMPQQPAPMNALPAYNGPELMPWMPEGDGQQQDFGAAGAGMASLIQRFAKPKGASPADAKKAFELGGSL